MNSLSLHLTPSLQTRMSPRLQQAVRLLQMSSQDFSQVLRENLDSNPFLEQDDTEATDSLAGNDSPAAPELSGESWGAELSGRAHSIDSETASRAFDTLQAQTSLTAHLVGQLNVMPLQARDRAIARAVVESLEEDGYLRVPLSDVVHALDLRPPVNDQELAIALRRVQALDPAGVGARHLGECLALQLPLIMNPAQRTLATAIVTDHLDALASRDFRAIARATGHDASALEVACAAIRRLDPHPGWRFGDLHVPYITPDVIVRRTRGRWTAVLNEAVVPRVKLNRGYVDMFRQVRDAKHPELAAHLQDARWTVRNVEQRFSTILGVAQAILKRQHHFLVHGPMAMKPLALCDIAREVGVHESTVSRATNNKFMATPCGVFELKYFFSRGLSTTSGGQCSPTAIRGLIQEMVGAESPEHPLSDVEIARQLEAQGLQVARRTVTKYRQLLRIEPADRRGARSSAG